MSDLELRHYETKSIEVRADGEGMNISGYAIVFDEPSKPLYGGMFVETISKRALQGVDLADLFLLYNHNDNDILGSTVGNTMSVSVDERGLRFDASLPNTQLGKDTFELIKRGDIRGVSFGFMVESDTWNTSVTPEHRTINKIKEVKELSITAFPAYDQTEVSARAINFIETCKDCKIDINTQEANYLLKQVQKNEHK